MTSLVADSNPHALPEVIFEHLESTDSSDFCNGLGVLRRRRRSLFGFPLSNFLPIHRDFTGSLNTETNSVALNAYHRQHDSLADADLFSTFARQYQHGGILLEEMNEIQTHSESL